MKNKLLFSIIIQFIYLNSTACVCELEESMKKDSIFNPENIMKDYPVVFVGKLIKHEWPRLSLYKIIWNFKGLDNEDEIIAIKNNSCNMFDKIGDTILVSGYLNKPEVRFLHQTNCRGTKILRNLDGNYLDYFRRNKHFETNSQDSILKIPFIEV